MATAEETENFRFGKTHGYACFSALCKAVRPYNYNCQLQLLNAMLVTVVDYHVELLFETTKDLCETESCICIQKLCTMDLTKINRMCEIDVSLFATTHPEIDRLPISLCK